MTSALKRPHHKRLPGPLSSGAIVQALVTFLGWWRALFYVENGNEGRPGCGPGRPTSGTLRACSAPLSASFTISAVNNQLSERTRSVVEENSVKLAEAKLLNERGQPYSAQSVRAMLQGPQKRKRPASSR